MPDAQELFDKPEIRDLIGEYASLSNAAARFAVVEKALKEWFASSAEPGLYQDDRIQVEIDFQKRIKIKALLTESE